MPPPCASILLFFESTQGKGHCLSKHDATHGLPFDFDDDFEVFDPLLSDGFILSLDMTCDGDTIKVSSIFALPKYRRLIGSQNDDRCDDGGLVFVEVELDNASSLSTLSII